MNKKVKSILARTYFIGGSPCSGKSTAAEVLAEKYNLNYYKLDDYQFEHLKQADPDKHPTMYKYSQLGWEEMWMRSVDLQVKEVFDLYRERFEMILEELKQFTGNKSVIMEGAPLLPELLDSLGIKNDRVVYLVPSKEFQVKHYSQREFIGGILAECEDPEKAFENWMERDHQFGKRIMTQAENIGYKVIYVDGERSSEENIDIISKHFGLKS